MGIGVDAIGVGPLVRHCVRGRAAAKASAERGPSRCIVRSRYRLAEPLGVGLIHRIHGSYVGNARAADLGRHVSHLHGYLY